MRMDNGNKTQMKIHEARAMATNLVKMNAEFMAANPGAKFQGPLGSLVMRSIKLARKLKAQAK